MHTVGFLFSICFYQLLITTSLGWRPYVAEFTNVSTFSLVNFIDINSSISSNGSISIYADFHQDVTNVYSKSTVRLKTASNNYDLELINKTVNDCEFFRNRKYEPILQIFYRTLTKNGSFPNSCPIRKKLYFIKDVLIDTEDLPPVLPSNKVLVEITLMIKTGDKFKTLMGFTINYQVRQLNEKIND